MGITVCIHAVLELSLIHMLLSCVQTLYMYNISAELACLIVTVIIIPLGQVRIMSAETAVPTTAPRAATSVSAIPSATSAARRGAAVRVGGLPLDCEAAESPVMYCITCCSSGLHLHCN